MLYCVECGCCSELGRGWVATRCDDPDPDIALYCPPCAAAEFGFRPDVAANYVCAWEPLRDAVRSLTCTRREDVTVSWPRTRAKGSRVLANYAVDTPVDEHHRRAKPEDAHPHSGVRADTWIWIAVSFGTLLLGIGVLEGWVATR